MLCGTFLMIWLMHGFLQRPIQWVGSRLGLSPAGTAGLLAAAANVMPVFRLIQDMPPRDKVLVISFAVCGAFMFGDHPALAAGQVGQRHCAGFAIATRLQNPVHSTTGESA